jgi:hypothetical protein
MLLSKQPRTKVWEALQAAIQAYRWDWWTDALAQAFALSVAFHILVFGLIEIGNQAGWWQISTLEMLRKSLQPMTAQAKPNPLTTKTARPNQDTEPPLLFVDVSPTQTAAEPPKDARYYSYANSQAANPNPQNDTAIPRVDGNQNKTVKTLDVPRPTPMVPQPATPPPTPQAPPKSQPVTPSATKPVEPAPSPVETKPKELAKATTPAVPTNVKPGNTQMGESQPKPAQRTGPIEPIRPAADSIDSPAPRPRPRTLAEARQQNPGLAGEKMKQEGGVKRHALEASLDVRKQPFGQYDAMFIAAVQKRWFDILDERDYVQGHSGKVVLRFNLYYDGRITNLEIAENNVGELLAVICQRAILDPSPYAPWPTELRRMAKANYREVQFTFYYSY